MMSKKLLGAVIVALALLAGAWRWFPRSTEADNAGRSVAGDAPAAAVVRVERGQMDNTLTIAGEFKPFEEVEVHAKVAGYIRKIYVDVGDHVKQGQTVAMLEVPELAAQLGGADAAVRRARDDIRREESDLARAQSAHAAAHSLYARLQQASEQQKGLVAQQELDEAQAKDLETEAQVSSAQAASSAAEQQVEVALANQKQYSAMSAYTRIVAPFTGIVTMRYADTGSLVAAGTSSSTQAIPVVRIAEVSKLRLVLPIPESMAAEIHLGDPVKVRVEALHSEIAGKVSRFADSLDIETRTMQTQIDFDNRNGRLMPGMYAETRLVLAERPNTLSLPLEAVTQSGTTATVLLVTPESTVVERKITLGLEGHSRVEVLSGLREGDRVVVGNRSRFRDGEKVEPKEVAPNATAGGAS
jgi:RND family efflux transporter MFP subunit